MIRPLALAAVTALAAGVLATQPASATIEIDGHRGREYAADVTNENTRAAFEYDAKHHVDCETDTPRIANAAGVPSAGPSVIFHDVKPATIKRIASPESVAQAGLTGHETIDQVTPAEFRILDARGGEDLLTLKQGVRVIGQLGISCKVDLKYKPEDPAQVMRWATRWDADLSFYQLPQDPEGPYPCALNGMTAMADAGFPVGVKARPGCVMSFEKMHDLGVSYVAAHAQDVTPEYVTQAHAEDLLVGPMLAGRACWDAMRRAHVDFVIVKNPATFKKWING